MDTKSEYTIVGMNFQPEPTGNAPYTTDLAEMLGHQGSVNVITGFPYYPSWSKNRLVSDKEFLQANPSIKISRVNHYVPKSTSNLKRFIMEVAFGVNVVRRGRLTSNVILLVTPALLSSVIVRSWIFLTQPRARVLVWVQDLYAVGMRETRGSESIPSKVLEKLESWLLNSSDGVIFAHESFLNVKKSLIRHPENTSVIRNWSQFVLNPNQTREATRANYGFEGFQIALHIGNMGVKQGLENLVAAARLAQKTKSTVRFVFVGGGNQEGKLRDLADGCSAAIFLGTVSDQELSNILLSADVLLVNEKPGVKEMSIPSKLTTYFQTGVPTLVCSEMDSNAAKELFKEDIGHWVKSGSPSLLLEEIIEIVSSEKSDKALRAIIYAEENFSKAKALKKFASLFRGALSEET